MSRRAPRVQLVLLAAMLAMEIWGPMGYLVRSIQGAEPGPTDAKCVILVTLDGLRWQEVFGGADERLLNKESGGVRDLERTRQRFWRESEVERRAALMPFFWDVIAPQGQVFGDATIDSPSRVTNGRNFSFPGYNEILAGRSDERIDSNDKVPNPNVTVLEWLNRRPGFEGQVAAFASWDVFPFIINDQRSGIHVNAGWQRDDGTAAAPSASLLNELADETPHVWENVRYDVYTLHAVLEHLGEHSVRVLYVAFGETDDWAHEGRYDLYLDAAWRTDRYIRRLWDAIQSRSEYRGRTSLLLTTDHGRGDTREDWKNHGKDVPGADRIWMAVMGPHVPAAGLVRGAATTQGQVAATVAALVGEDFCAGTPQAAPVLPGVVTTAR